MAMDPTLNSKIRMMSALAPVTYLEYAETPLMLIAPFVDQIEVNPNKIRRNLEVINRILIC